MGRSTRLIDQHLRQFGTVKDDRVLTCELRNDDRAGAGFDVQLLEGRELRASRRCVDGNGARFVAESYREDLLRTGWSE